MSTINDTEDEKVKDAPESDKTTEIEKYNTKDETADNDEIPPEVLKVKEKLERQSGKKYKYRPKHKDIPVTDLMKYGVPGQEAKAPQTWKERLMGPLFFASLFALSLFILHHTVLKYPSNIPPYAVQQEMKRKGLNYIHPRYKNTQRQQQQQQQQQPPEEDAQAPQQKIENTNNEF